MGGREYAVGTIDPPATTTNQALIGKEGVLGSEFGRGYDGARSREGHVEEGLLFVRETGYATTHLQWLARLQAPNASGLVSLWGATAHWYDATGNPHGAAAWLETFGRSLTA